VGWLFCTVNFRDMYERMEVKLHGFISAELGYLERIDLFQALLCLPSDERNLSTHWLESHVNSRANYVFVSPSVIEDGSPSVMRSSKWAVVLVRVLDMILDVKYARKFCNVPPEIRTR